MVDFAQVMGIHTTVADVNAGTVRIGFDVIFQHAGEIVQDTLATTFAASGGIAALNAAVKAAVQASFQTHFGVALTNVVCPQLVIL